MPLRAALALGGMFIVSSSLLLSTPIAGAAPSTDAVDTINDRYATFGGESSLLGIPTAEAIDVPGGAVREYQGGAIYYSQDTGAHVMYGAILDRYRALGGPSSELGFPTNDEGDTGDGVGRFNDFSTPGGAAIYWNPQWGASVIRGRVLETWRQAGAVSGPFGYPSADTSIMDGVQTGKFVGPEGTEIQWSKTGGLITIPAALAATIPGLSATTPTSERPISVSPPDTSITAEPTAMRSSKWWWIPAGVAAAALLAGLIRVLTRGRPEEPIPVPAQRAPVATSPPTKAPPTKAPPATPPPARPVTATTTPAPAPPASPAPPRIAPVAKVSRTPAPGPAASPPAPVPLLSEPPKATIRTASTDRDLSAVVTYEGSAAAAETAVQVTYENNAVGHNQADVADKSDSVPD
jgi:hypothetical protein